MLTVGQLITQLRALDKDLPVGVLAIDQARASNRVNIQTGSLADVDVVHEHSSGIPLAVWLTAQGRDDASNPEIASLKTVVVMRATCSCLLPVRVDQRRNINLDAISCAHHVPADIIERSAHTHGQ